MDDFGAGWLSSDWLNRLNKKTPITKKKHGYSVQKAYVIMKHNGDTDGAFADWALTEPEADKKVAGFYAAEREAEVEYED